MLMDAKGGVDFPQSSVLLSQSRRQCNRALRDGRDFRGSFYINLCILTL